jgi:hypothetical protein
MAQRTVTVSDLSGKPGAEAVTFAFDGTAYVMEITAAEKRAFASVLKPYLGIARPVPAARAGVRPRGQAPKPVVQRLGRPVPAHLEGDAPAPAPTRATKKTAVKKTPAKKTPAKKTPAKKSAANRPAPTAGIPAPAATVRAWAVSKKIPVPDRGRIPADVMVKFEAAHPVRAGR